MCLKIISPYSGLVEGNNLTLNPALRTGLFYSVPSELKNFALWLMMANSLNISIPSVLIYFERAIVIWGNIPQHSKLGNEYICECSMDHALRNSPEGAIYRSPVRSAGLSGATSNNIPSPERAQYSQSLVNDWGMNLSCV